jgi:hypothetical protein
VLDAGAGIVSLSLAEVVEYLPLAANLVSTGYSLFPNYLVVNLKCKERRGASCFK